MEKSTVQSVERTFDIIEALSQAPKGIGLSGLSSATSLNKSTVHRLLGCLIKMGYVAQDENSAKYYLTIKMYEVGGRILNKLDMMTIARPYLEKLSNITGEAVHLVVRDGVDIVYIFKEDAGNNSVRMASQVGLRSPMYCTAVGKAILAELPDKDVSAIWDKSIIVKRTKNTITAFDELKEQLDVIRTKGYALDNEENELDVRCVGASILDNTGKAIGAFSVTAPVGRMNSDRLLLISDLVLKTRKEICAELGFNPGI